MWARWRAHLVHDAEALSQDRHQIAAEIDAGVVLRGAESELLSALGNLVSNAVRYTPDGGRIAIRLSFTDGHSVFSVSDTGLGIAPSTSRALTERFYRVDRSRSRDTGGTGSGAGHRQACPVAPPCGPARDQRGRARQHLPDRLPDGPQRL